MRLVFVVLFLGSSALGAIVLQQAPAVTQQLAGLILILIGAVFLVGAAVLHALAAMRLDWNKHTAAARPWVSTPSTPN